MWNSEIVRLNGPFHPFGEERIYESVFALEVIDDFFSFELGDGLFNGGGIVDVCRRKEAGGAYRLPAEGRYRLEDASLKRRELPDKKGEMLMLACVDDVKGAGYGGLADCVAAGGDLPKCIAELLHKAGRIARNDACGVERLTRENSPVLGEARFEKSVKVVGGYAFYAQRSGAAIERAFRVEEYVRHAVPDAAEEYICRVGVELDASAHDGYKAFSVFNVEDVLEFIKHDAYFSFGSLGRQCVENGFERGWSGGEPRIQGNGGRTGRRVNRNYGPKVRDGAQNLRKPAVRFFESRKCGDQPPAHVGLVADAEEVRMKKRYAFHAANSVKDERGLAHSALALHYNILPGLYFLW